MSTPFLDALQRRRTQYALDKTLPIDRAQVDALIQQAVKWSPSSFNSQSSRVVILHGEHSDRLWRIVLDTLREIVPAENFAATEARIAGFAAGAGTVLFYEDQDTVAELQAKFPLYADNFPAWSEQAGGMAQLAVWTVLAEAGIGASLQHYNPLIDDKVADAWDIPAGWRLRAQMPFGANAGPIGDKDFIDDATRFRVHGA